MKTNFSIVGAIVLIALSCPAWPLDVPKELDSVAKTAENEGAALYFATQNPAPKEDSDIDMAKSRISDFCNFKYKAVPVMLQGKMAIFFLAQPPDSGGIVFGRHYKVSGSNVTASTKSCFNIPPAPPGAVGSYITHLLSSTPSEFHVYLSLKHKNPVFVETSAGNWVVEDGKIQFVKER